MTLGIREQPLGFHPFVAHLSDINIPLGSELLYKLNDFGRERNYSI